MIILKKKKKNWKIKIKGYSQKNINYDKVLTKNSDCL